MKPIYFLRRRYISACLFLLLTVIISGCKDQVGTTSPPTNDDPTILEVIQSNSNLETLEELLEGSTILSGSGAKTIFAPSDAAFAKLDSDYLEGLTNQQKLNLLKYHIYNGSYPINNEIKREAISSQQGDPIFLEIGQSFGNLINNKAQFTTTNLEAANGLIHIIDEVLIPDQFGTLADNIKKRYEYRKFYERLESAGLVDHLTTPGSKTLLTTSDASLDYYENVAGLSFTEEEWKEIMKYHILDVDFSVTGPGTRMAIPTMAADSVYLTVDEPGKFNINGNGDPYLFVNATNGKIFLNPSIMLPDKHIGVLTVMDKRFYVRTARAALAIAKMTGRLYNSENNADEMFTIFIPRNEAVGLPTSEEELANVLKYHVLLEKLTAEQLEHNQTYTTWQGEQITITKNGDQEVIINGTATIKLANLTGNNGVVHVIDQVLTPPTE